MVVIIEQIFEELVLDKLQSTIDPTGKWQEPCLNRVFMVSEDTYTWKHVVGATEWNNILTRRKIFWKWNPELESYVPGPGHDVYTVSKLKMWDVYRCGREG